MKKKKHLKLSLHMRITLITWLVMALICILITAFTLINSEVWVVEQIDSITGSQVIDVVGQADESGKTGYDSDKTISEFPTDSANFEDNYYPDESSEVLVQIDDNNPHNIVQFYTKPLIAVALILILGAFLIYFVVGISLKPLKVLKNHISSIDESDLYKRVEDFSDIKELDSISRSFNQMLERIETAFEREKEFSAAAAHELKTPLSVIRTNIDVLNLSKSPSKEEYISTLSVVKNLSDKMAVFVDDLFAMFAMGDYETEEIFNASKLIEEVVKEQKQFANDEGIQVTFDIIDCNIKGNYEMLKHAISNLVQNAVKYNTKNGKVIITSNKINNDYSITVSDTGIGISPDAVPHIFEPFYRETKSKQSKKDGAGLGLAIVKNIVEQHNGTIEYRQNESKGSDFIITLHLQ